VTRAERFDLALVAVALAIGAATVVYQLWKMNP
jgi:hypothetical protein